MSIEKVIVDAARLANIFQVIEKAIHPNLPFGDIQNFMNDFKSHVRPYVEDSAPEVNG